MGVSKNRGTPKWMVYNGKNLLKLMILGYHYFRKHPYTGMNQIISQLPNLGLETFPNFKLELEFFQRVPCEVSSNNSTFY